MAGLSVTELAEALGDPAPAWRYDGQFPDFGIGAPPIAWLQRAEVSHFFLEPNQKMVGGMPQHFPEMAGVDALSLTWWVRQDFPVYGYFLDWQGRVMVRTGRNKGSVGLPKDYKRTFSLSFLDNQGNVALTQKYKGAWPTRPEQWSLDGSSSANLVLAISLSVDEVETTFANQTLISKVGGLNGVPIPTVRTAGSTVDNT